MTAAITDNDAAGVVITESASSTELIEAGATDTYTVVLTAEPTADVTVTVSPDAESGVSAGTLTFTAANWDTAQTITVTATDDALIEGAHSSTIAHTTSSSDTDFDGLTVSSVTAAITDNDAAGVVITESASSTELVEAGATDTYTVVLTAEPTADVVVAVSPDAESGVSAGTLTFTAANWDTAQTITVTATDDALILSLIHI